MVSSSASLTTSLTSPGIGATFTSPALIPLAAVTFGGSNAVASVEFIAGTTKIGADTIAPYAFTWTNVPVGTYTLVARAMDVAGGSVTSMPVTITVAAPGGDPHVADVESKLREVFATKVKLHYALGKGAVEISFFSDAELERILQVLGVRQD